MKSVGLWATRIGLMICVGIGTVELGQRVQAGDGAVNAEMSVRRDLRSRPCR